MTLHYTGLKWPMTQVADGHLVSNGQWCKGMEVGDAGFSLCGGLVKTTKSLSAFLSWVISSLSGGWLAKCLVLTAA